MFCKSKKFVAFFAGTIVVFSNYSQTVFGMNEKDDTCSVYSDDNNNLTHISLDSEEYKKLFTATDRSNTISNMLLGNENLSDNKNDHTENSSEHFNEDSSRFITSEEYKELFGEAQINSNNTTDNTVDNNDEFVLCNDTYINIAAKHQGKCCPCMRSCPEVVCTRLGRFIKKHQGACSTVLVISALVAFDFCTNHALINTISSLF